MKMIAIVPQKSPPPAKPLSTEVTE